jgi:integrase
MASIQQIGKRWRALVRRKGYKPLCSTFDTRREAEAWARQVEAGIDAGKAPADTQALGRILSEYRRMRAELGRPIDPASNTHYMLQHLDEDLGSLRVSELTPQRLADWARMRKEQGAGGYTVNMELSALGTALRHTGSFLGIQIPDVVGAARPLLHYAQLIGGGNKRTRRPTEDELSALLAWLDGRNKIVADAVRVAAVVGLRRGELARIQWADLDEEKRAVLVRQRKHPRRVEARDEWVPLLGPAWDIVQRQPRKDGRIFPVSVEALTDNVTAGTRALGIPDLRLHDTRRAANSTLREMGFDDDARRAVLGHASKEMNSRYVAVTLESLHQQYAAAGPDKPPRRPRRRATPGRPDEAT